MTITINSTLIPAGTWKTDTTHSTAGFVVRHAGISKVRGSFSDFNATVIVSDDSQDVTVDAVIKAESFTTGDANRDQHVKSKDFFEVESYPELTFSNAKLVESEDGLILDGDLTIRGIVKRVQFNVEFNGFIVDSYGLNRIGLEAETTISRKDYGMTWGSAVEVSGVLISDKVKIVLDLSFVQDQS